MNINLKFIISIMNNFTFAIVLNYAERTFSLKSPFSFNSLIEIALDKFELTKLNYLSYFDADDDEIKLSNDHDYLNLFDYVESNGLKEINVFLKSNESKCKKSTYKFNTITFLPSNEYQCVNDECYMEAGDLRNPKFGKEDQKWSKQSKSFKEINRIEAIKAKKENQREMQRNRNKIVIDIQAPIQKDNEDVKKRKLKNPKTRNV